MGNKPMKLSPILVVVLFLACTTPQPVNKRLPIEAEVVYLHRDVPRVLLRHGTVPGWAESGLTEIPVKDETEYKALRVGQRVIATVVIETGTEHLSGIKVIKEPEIQPGPVQGAK